MKSMNENARSELQGLLDMIKKKTIDLEAFLEDQKSKKLDSKNVQMLRIQFYNMLADSDMSNEAAQKARKRFEEILEMDE